MFLWCLLNRNGAPIYGGGIIQLLAVIPLGVRQTVPLPAAICIPLRVRSVAPFPTAVPLGVRNGGNDVLLQPNLEWRLYTFSSIWSLTGSFRTLFSVVSDISVKYYQVLHSKKKRLDLGHTLCIYRNIWMEGFETFVLYIWLWSVVLLSNKEEIPMLHEWISRNIHVITHQIDTSINII